METFVYWYLGIGLAVIGAAFAYTCATHDMSKHRFNPFLAIGTLLIWPVLPLAIAGVFIFEYLKSRKAA